MFDVERWVFASLVSLAIFPAPMNLLINLSLVLFVLVALIMVLVILMQRPKSEGLGAAFGGGVTENLFGAQTTKNSKLLRQLLPHQPRLNLHPFLLQRVRPFRRFPLLLRRPRRNQQRRRNAGVSFKRTKKRRLPSRLIFTRRFESRRCLRSAAKFAELLLLRHTLVTIGF